MAKLSHCIWSKWIQLQLAVAFGLCVLSLHGTVRVCMRVHVSACVCVCVWGGLVSLC